MRRRDFLAKGGCAALVTCVGTGRCWSKTRRAAGKTKPGGRWSTLIADLKRVIPKMMEEAVVPGLSIALVGDGKLLWRQGFGVEDVATKKPVDDYTVFEAASVSKTVFAYAVMKLCEKGVIDLDSPLTKYKRLQVIEGDPRLELITARHVLSHTTGFQDWRSKHDALRIHFTPGEEFLYSGEGYSYLQAVVTQMTGHVNSRNCSKYEADVEVCATDIDQYMKRNLLVPFRMASSGYVWNQGFEKHVASPHDSSGRSRAKSRPTPVDAARYGSAGGLHTTAIDYVRFLIEILDPKKRDAFRLGEKSLKEMLRPQVKLSPGKKIDGADSWALGWAVQERPTGNIILHSGGQAGFRSLTMASVERKSGFIMLTNGDGGGKVIFNQTLGELMNQLLAA